MEEQFDQPKTKAFYSRVLANLHLYLFDFCHPVRWRSILSVPFFLKASYTRRVLENACREGGTGSSISESKALMMWKPSTLLLTLSLLCPAWGADTCPAQTYRDCQRFTPNPLHGCPHGTIFVSQTDHRARFTSIQAAIRSLPNDTSPHVILIGAGTYVEQLNVTRSGPLTLLGQSDRPWKGQSYGNSNATASVQNEVQIYWNAANNNHMFPDNVNTGVLTIGPTYNATITGAGPTGYPVPADTPFGCSDFRAYNIDFRNEYVPYADGPSHAVGLGYANAGFYSCGLYSYQDTVSSSCFFV